MPFLDDHFLLANDTARWLYHDVAAYMPIYDYHTHLDPGDIARNRVYDNLAEIWLEGDHYKWRAMRACGVEERYITGDAEPYDKFLAWAKCVPQTLRNPLYHWTHLELRRYFGIEVLLNEGSAKEVWDEANRQLPKLSTRAIFDKFKVALVGTTDDPADALDHHATIARLGMDTVVVPTFRPDKAMDISDPARFGAYVDRLGERCGHRPAGPGDVVSMLAQRHAFFHQHGGRLSDHGLAALPDVECECKDFHEIGDRVMRGHAVGRIEQAKFASHFMRFFGRLNAEKGWAMQLHLGPVRNLNRRLFNQLGPDIGCDSMNDEPQGPGLTRLLGALSQEGKLPKTVLYNLNPVNNHLFATMLGNFQNNEQGIKSKMQFGSGWWFLDQKDGMIQQLNTLSSLGLLSHFVGMLTDSRSMMSYPRHEYFRRILCNLIGADVENGELPDDAAVLQKLVADVCFNNARDYFGIAL